MRLSLTFVLNRNFLDPKFIKIKNKEGKEEEVPYGPYKYKELIKESYLISRHLHTSYIDALKLTPTERTSLLQLLREEFEETRKANEKDLQANRELLESIKVPRKR